MFHFAVFRRWISFEFKKHQIRVGDPWTNCNVGDTGTGTDTGTTVGTIIPVSRRKLFGLILDCISASSDAVATAAVSNIEQW